MDYKRTFSIFSRVGWPLLACFAISCITQCTHFARILPGCYDTNRADSIGYTPLIIAAESGTTDDVRRALRCRPDPNHRTYDGRTALLFALERADLASVEMLLKAGANPNLRAYSGVTPVYRAVRTGRTWKTDSAEQRKTKRSRTRRIVGLLLAAGAKPGLAPPTRDPVTASVATDDARLLEMLLKAGGNPNAVDFAGDPVLQNAARHGNLKSVELLLSAGANPNHRDQHGKGIVHALVLTNKSVGEEERMLKIFVRHKVNLNIVDDRGRTALFEAYPRWILPLLRSGLDPAHRDDTGRTAREHYLAADWREFPSLFKRGGDWSTRTPYIDRIEQFMETQDETFARQRHSLKQNVVLYRDALSDALQGRVDEAGFLRRIKPILRPETTAFARETYQFWYRNSHARCGKQGGRLELKPEASRLMLLATGKAGGLSKFYFNTYCFIAKKTPNRRSMDIENVWSFENGNWYFSADPIPAYRGIPERKPSNTLAYYRENVNALERIKQGLDRLRKLWTPGHPHFFKWQNLEILARPLADLPGDAGLDRIHGQISRYRRLHQQTKPDPERIKAAQKQLETLLEDLIGPQSKKAFDAARPATSVTGDKS